MNTAVFSVVYPGIDDYFAEFLASLSRQSNKNFTLFLINDGLSNLAEFLQRADLEVNVQDAGEGSPAKLRKTGIQWIMESGADAIVFADADDTFAENRVEISCSILDKHDLVFNELILTGQGGVDGTPMLGTHFREGEVVDSAGIRTANSMGLSNTAIRVKSIPASFKHIPDHLIAFDWAFFALCLHAGLKGIFSSRTATYYRQHGNNLANPCSLEEAQILRGVQVKSDHYRFLSRFYEEYLSLADRFGELRAQLQSDEILRRAYCQAVRKFAPVMPLWWEPIKTLEAVGL
jgi:glycosyltransferase involved in cell wall biosynthesis